MPKANLYLPNKDKLSNEEIATTIFFSMVDLYKSKVENVLKKALDYRINMTSEHIKKEEGRIEVVNTKTNKKNIKRYMNLGYYDIKKETWYYYSTINNLYDGIKENYDLQYHFGSKGKPLLNSLFSKKIKILKKDHYIIPYFIQILFDQNLVKFTDGKTIILYSFMDFGFKDNINLDDFEKEMDIYRMSEYILKSKKPKKRR
jgi:hypothetical protein